MCRLDRLTISDEESFQGHTLDETEDRRGQTQAKVQTGTKNAGVVLRYQRASLCQHTEWSRDCLRSFSRAFFGSPCSGVVSITSESEILTEMVREKLLHLLEQIVDHLALRECLLGDPLVRVHLQAVNLSVSLRTLDPYSPS